MIERRPLRADIHQEILKLLLTGELAPGQRLKDLDFAERFGVSRTPVREALLRLEREGFLSSQMNIGFTVRPLSIQEARELYPLVQLLEGFALNTGGLATLDQLTRLRELNRSIRDERKDPLRRIHLDQEWHLTLLRGCRNTQLFKLLADLKGILFRYELHYMQVSAWVEDSYQDHEHVIRNLAEGDLATAAQIVDAHWERCQEFVIQGLEPKATTPEILLKSEFKS